MVLVSSDTVGPLLIEWQERLRLQDWSIKIAVVPHTRTGSLGSARMHAKYKGAEIEIMNPAFIDPAIICNTDVEVTLVHELLHLQGGALTEYLEDEKLRWYHDEMERLVELTAIALVKLKRDRAG